MRATERPLTVAVLRGGPSSEYDVSLKTGATVLRNMPQQHTSRDIFIDRNGTWHVGGLPQRPVEALHGVDVVFNALHGQYGEDGKVQRQLESLGVPFTGADKHGAAKSMNKRSAKKIFEENGLRTPPHVVVNRDDDIDRASRDIFFHFHMPVVVKPVSAGSSIGVGLADTLAALVDALHRAFEYDDEVLVEMYVVGREATCGIVEDFRGQKYYAPLPIEIVHRGRIFGLDAKYDHETHAVETICPPNFSDTIKTELQRMSQVAHAVLGLRHYSRSDFRITPTGRIYILETNSLPGLTEQSLLPTSLQAIGCGMPHFIDHVLALALDES